jgi:hypothetical protein
MKRSDDAYHSFTFFQCTLFKERVSPFALLLRRHVQHFIGAGMVRRGDNENLDLPIVMSYLNLLLLFFSWIIVDALTEESKAGRSWSIGLL